jgi:ribosomal protein L18E
MARPSNLTEEQKAAKKIAAAQAKKDNFIRLAETRVENALISIAKVGGLANRATYDYTEAQVLAIGKALEKEVIATMRRFSPTAEPSAKSGFSLAAAVEAVQSEATPSE